MAPERDGDDGACTATCAFLFGEAAFDVGFSKHVDNAAKKIVARKAGAEEVAASSNKCGTGLRRCSKAEGTT